VAGGAGLIGEEPVAELGIVPDVDPVMVVGSGRFGVSVSSVAPGGGDFVGGSVAEPAVGSMVVAVDVDGDVLSGVLDGLPFAAPGAAFLELAEPRLDERLRLGVAVAALR
jgi:hypothetical protein